MPNNDKTSHSRPTSTKPTQRYRKLRWFEEPPESDCPVFDKDKGRQFALNAQLRRQGGQRYSL